MLKVIHFIISVLMITPVLAQKKESSLSISLSIGAFKGMTQEKTFSPFLFRGSKLFAGLAVGYLLPRTQHTLSFAAASPRLRSSADPNNSSISASFYTLQYSLLKPVNHHEKMKIYLGGSLTGRECLRRVTASTGQVFSSGEVLGSVEAKIKIRKKIAPLSSLNSSVSLPIVSFILHKNYPFTAEDSDVVTQDQLQSFNFAIGYQVALSRSVDFFLSYDLFFYHYKFEWETSVAVQQFYGGLTYNF